MLAAQGIAARCLQCHPMNFSSPICGTVLPRR